MERGVHIDNSQKVTKRIGYQVKDPVIGAESDKDVSSTSASGSRRETVVLRVLNATVAALALVLLFPLMIVIAVAIRLDSPGPVLYRQLRIGIDRRSDDRDSRGQRRTADMGGKPFVMYKFRTMKDGAERESGPIWASEDDDRTTRVGRVLRHYRLDELPQLWNVLKGDMAVVGPRPERPKFVGRLRDEINEYPKRQKVPPGITGWAQIHREMDHSVDDVRRKLQYDLDYVERRSVWFDFQIMLRTPIVMLNRDRISSGTDHSPETMEGS